MAFRFVPLLLVALINVNLASAGTSEEKRVLRISPRIVGGRDATKIYPYQASIRRNGRHSCGGSLLNQQWILTAAHCLEANVNSYIVVLGSHHAVSGGAAYFPDKIVQYPYYNKTTNVHDIGLMRLRASATYSKFVAPVNLPTQDIDESNCIAVFTGWGNTKKSGGLQNWLQEIYLNVLSWKTCRKTFQKVTSDNICTLNKHGEGICYGDSGSPLVLLPDNVQIGIGSWGTPCAIGKPDVHTRVYPYVDWIKSTIFTSWG